MTERKYFLCNGEPHRIFRQSRFLAKCHVFWGKVGNLISKKIFVTFKKDSILHFFTNSNIEIFT